MSEEQVSEEQEESVAFTDSYDIATNRFKSMIDEQVSSLTITPQEVQETERLTRGQWKSNLWFEGLILNIYNDFYGIRTPYTTD